jgi:hypothetical protein
LKITVGESGLSAGHESVTVFSTTAACESAVA